MSEVKVREKSDTKRKKEDENIGEPENDAKDMVKKAFEKALETKLNNDEEMEELLRDNIFDQVSEEDEEGPVTPVSPAYLPIDSDASESSDNNTYDPLAAANEMMRKSILKKNETTAEEHDSSNFDSSCEELTDEESEVEVLNSFEGLGTSTRIKTHPLVSFRETTLKRCIVQVSNANELSRSKKQKNILDLVYNQLCQPQDNLIERTSTLVNSTSKKKLEAKFEKMRTSDKEKWEKSQITMNEKLSSQEKAIDSMKENSAEHLNTIQRLTESERVLKGNSTHLSKKHHLVSRKLTKARKKLKEKDEEIEKINKELGDEKAKFESLLRKQDDNERDKNRTIEKLEKKLRYLKEDLEKEKKEKRTSGTNSGTNFTLNMGQPNPFAQASPFPFPANFQNFPMPNVWNNMPGMQGMPAIMDRRSENRNSRNKDPHHRQQTTDNGGKKDGRFEDL